MREEEEEAIIDANNLTADTFSPAFSPQRENPNAIFANQEARNFEQASQCSRKHGNKQCRI